MNRTKIDWCDYTWNPVIGCMRGCQYCYAKDAHDMRRTALLSGKKMPECYREPFEKIQFFPERLEDPYKVKKPSKIFVGSVSDVQFWSIQQVMSILKVCKENKQHTFMFLSKDPFSYKPYNWPDNAMLGLTITGKDNVHIQHHKLLNMAGNTRTFLSVEPLLGQLRWDFKCAELVIVGAMTGRTKNLIKPKQEWIKSITDRFPPEKIFWKENIKKYLL